jgi:hypothetical protein
MNVGPLDGAQRVRSLVGIPELMIEFAAGGDKPGEISFLEIEEFLKRPLKERTSPRSPQRRFQPVEFLLEEALLGVDQIDLRPGLEIDRVGFLM